MLRHVDGVVFVVDSQDGRQSENIESIKNLDTNLRLQGDDPDRIPLVVQFNKRDLDNALPVADLVEHLNVPEEVPHLEASALHGGGVFETLKLIIKKCLALVGDPRKADEGRSPSILPGRRASMIPGAVPPAASDAIPKAPRVPRFDGED